ncbi:carboxymuconolactone decarboxylase family protein [Thalassotalea euphylliae]|uniref:Carboxymuconolactone decarboxylase family protein n=1 Tax=Thalassotalea euphylliae TaxID=1655234 RepID=A0A3E0U3G3_9GAMM|nr:carboxymuconolactone decarboxylase family protein [Thalassotalea euphylliae]REL31309.1 carboxymuconolactone decarboxylase family protein [Thalassotalea euphylliae]
MTILTLHNIDTAPVASRSLLQSSVDKFGWIPNQSAYMAESPALLSSYQHAHSLFSTCSLSEEEKTIVWITIGMINNCSYTVQAHSWIAKSNSVNDQLLALLIESPNKLPERSHALYAFTKSVARANGVISKAAQADFLAAGYTHENMLDVILGVSQKTMSTLLNSIAGTSIEPQFLPSEKE